MKELSIAIGQLLGMVIVMFLVLSIFFGAESFFVLIDGLFF